MIKRFKPSQPNGIQKEFLLPNSYVGGPITLFVNGQMVYSENEIDNYFGYILDQKNKKIIFYNPPEKTDFLYIMYDSDGFTENASDFSGKGLMRLNTGFNLISFQGQSLSNWNKEKHEIEYNKNILANVQNLIIDQVVDIYGKEIAGENGEKIIREISTFNADIGNYVTYKPGFSDTFWLGNGKHSIIKEIDIFSGDFDFSERSDNKVYYNPDNFILSRTYIENNKIYSSNSLNNLIDIPSGIRQGINIYIYPKTDLTKTDNALEIWF